jgi:hypothetical protein
MKVYLAIAKVAAALSKDGIGKDRKNVQQGYQFRGIDDVYNALAPILSANGLCILPNVMERTVVERVNKNGTALFYVTVKVEFAFVSAEDGSTHKVTTYGEAMDSGDKATNKAMSAAYKYAAMQAFCIPTEGDNDADATTHEVKHERTANKDAAKSLPSAPINPTTGALDAIPADRREVILRTGSEIVDCNEAGNMDAVMKAYDSITDTDEKTALWQFLGPYSALRREIKKVTDGRKKQKLDQETPTQA